MKLAVVLCVLAAVASAANTCPPGSFVKGSGPCPAGRDGNCCFCAKGYYNPGQNRPSCTACMVGRYSSAVGATSSRVCTVCPAGWFHPTNINAKALKVGASQRSQVCNACPEGRFNSVANKAGNMAFACTECAAGSYRTTTGATKKTDCIKCNSGSYTATFTTGATTKAEACKLKDKDCQFSEWSAFGRCSLMCGGGRQTRRRTMTANKVGNGSCGPEIETRPCNTNPCSHFDQRYPTYSELGNGLWWEMSFPANAASGLPAGMNAECRRQKNEQTGPFRFESLRSGVQNNLEGQVSTREVNYPVNGWCCKITTATHEKVGETSCWQSQDPGRWELNFMGTKLTYNANTGRLCKGGSCAQLKPMFVHKKVCDHTTCKVEDHTCTTYACPRGANKHLGGFCPNKGVGACNGATHKSIRVLHPGHRNKERADGHFCSITNKATNECTCYCLDVYKRQSSLMSGRYQRQATRTVSAQATGVRTTTDTTDIINPHFNHAVQSANAAFEN